MNPIPLNPTPGSIWTASEVPVQNEFVRRLNDAGIPTTLRDTRGKEIDGACGQLVATEETRRPPRRRRSADSPLHECPGPSGRGHSCSRGRR